jgi:transposase
LHTPSGFLYAFEAEDNTKKKTFTYREKPEEKRAEFIERLKRVPAGKRVFVDESGINESLQREFGRAPRGELVQDVKSGKKFERVNVIAAVCLTIYFAVKCYKHTTDSEFFEHWFEYCLLKEIPKGYTIIMDNASFHCKKRLRKLARGKVRLLFLPPYSPDYNPKEKSWANMKRFLRDSAQDCHSIGNAIYDFFGVKVS